MSLPAIADAAAANLATHFTWVQRRVPGMTVRDDGGVVLTDSGLPCDTFNAVCHARLDRTAAAGAITGALRHFADAARPFSWWVGPGDQPRDLGERLEAAGLARAESELAMSIRLDAMPDIDREPQGVTIRRVRSPAELRDFATLLAANWTPPDRHVLRFYELGAAILLLPDCPIRPYVGYVNDVAVATAEATVAAGVVGLYNISTLATHRGRGYGSAMTRAPLQDAAREGIDVAVLQAAPDGVGVYQRVGFHAFGQVDEFKPQ